MNDLIDELNEIQEQLVSFVDKANKSDSIKSLIELEEIANEVGKSWSGSWIGYQSYVYYRDFCHLHLGNILAANGDFFHFQERKKVAIGQN